ncbi:hypothetical protein FA045_04765 [Pedobacter cryotolerans]|uniref:Uncharacterized protein n=1 Tax=Pedobacter cryotolerans TaxID=2571270 RepID=A0A4U1CA63_9SPHI|nr:hypothetical protein FA045_04765 [Pedobacter cryotolerans]
MAFFAVACKPKADVNTIKDETMKLHDVVMANHSKIIGHQMKIDTLLKNLVDLKTKFPSIDTAAEKLEMQKLMIDLVKAEESMNDWMHNFNGDFKNEADTAVYNYYKKEHDKIAKVDELYKSEIKKSDTYLAKFKKQ